MILVGPAGAGGPNVRTLCGSCSTGEHMCDGNCDCECLSAHAARLAERRERTMETVNVGDRVTVARPGNRYRGRFAGLIGAVVEVHTNPTTERLQALLSIDPVCWFPIEELDPKDQLARGGSVTAVNVPDIRRRMHLAYADQDEKALAAGNWPEIKFLLEVWEADRDGMRQVAIERDEAWNQVDQYRQHRDQAREANALLIEEMAVAWGRIERKKPLCQPGACDTRLGYPDPEAGISHVRECDHGRVFLWEDGAWHPMRVEADRKEATANLVTAAGRAYERLIQEGLGGAVTDELHKALKAAQA